MIEFVIWTLLTLGIVTLTIILAERYGLEIAIGIFATLTVVANIVSSKLVAIGALIGPAGVIVYSATFLVTDIISEIYGKEYGKRAVITGFFANLVAVSAIMTAVLWTPANVPGNLETAKAFEKVFGLAPRIVFASMVAYIIAQMHDVYAFHFLKAKTGGKHLWLRNNASTMISQAIDTCIFITLAFYGVFPTNILLSMIFSQYVAKVVIALLDTPFMYVATYAWKVVSRSSS